MRNRILAITVMVAAVTAVGLGVGHFNARAGGQEKKVRPAAHDLHGGAFEQCAKACNDCQRICDACTTHCAALVAQGQKEHLRTLQTCQDCADFCAAAAQIVARRGPFADLICSACAEACARCGKECERFSADQLMQACAEECRRCEKACREMLKHVGHQAEKK
ncbi:MAG TPA: four-helix bundle copper-binding protein [Gemmataceae bacterium]|jgi:hypothetical protein|nr:four-helix bundle copper-binding protein [Gemmataceae bacterium]